MSTMRIDGKKIADDITQNLGRQLSGKSVCFIQFGKNEISERFIAAKTAVAEKLGIHVSTQLYEVATTQQAIEMLSKLPSAIDGVVVQLPLPKALDTQAIVNAIPQHLDIDMLSSASMQALNARTTRRLPPVASAVWKVLEMNHIETKQKKILIIGNGRLVGQPLGILFAREGITFTQCDKETPEELKMQLLREADIIISGIGVPYGIKPSMIKDGVVLIDAGTSEQAGKIAGDIDPDCYAKASLYTPVPGGIGPITIAGLYRNLLQQ